MIVILFSLLSAFAFAFHAIFIKVGLKDSDPFSGTLISSSVNLTFLWILTLLFVPFEAFFKEGLKYLVIGGVLAPSMARVFLYTGFEKVGVSIAAPIRTIFPIVSSVLAVIFLKEPLTVTLGAAIILTVLGATLLSISSSGIRMPAELKWKKKDLFFPLTAAIFYGVSHFIRKIGMASIPSGITAATIVTTVSLTVYILSLPFIKQKREMVITKRSVLYFILGGLAASCGQILILSALGMGKVTIVTPLGGITPLFVLLMSYLFFKGTERINTFVVSGVISIVLGVVILSSLA